MKIIVIMGSPRKGNTYRACEEFRELVQKDCDAEFEYVWLKDKDIRPCKGCFVCFPHGEDRCPHRGDDVQEIVKKMDEADGVVFASPVYGFNVSGQMKMFFDRISYICHRPRFFGKKAFILSSTGGYGTKFPLDYMAGIANVGWGFEVVGTVGVVTMNTGVPPYRAKLNTELLSKAARKYSRALTSDKIRRPNLKSVVIFNVARASISPLEKISPADHTYWNEKTWLSPKARYYVDVPVNPLYSAIGRAIGRSMSKRSKNDLLADVGSSCGGAADDPA